MEQLKREWFFEQTNDFEYENEEHKEDMYKYVNYMIYGGTKPDTKDEYINRGVYKFIEQQIEEDIEKTLADQEEKDYIQQLIK